jgi:DNA polymerase-3 subunit epsilon
MKTRDHQLEATESGYRCRICTWTWKQYPQSDCPGLPGSAYEEVPAHLLSYTQLKARGLKPRDRAAPDGCYFRVHRRQWLYLYDERQALPMRCESPKQKEAREKTWRAIQEKYRCPECGQAPHHLAEIKAYRADRLCDQCVRYQAYLDKQTRLEAMIKEDEKAACQWAASMLERDDWCILDTETTDLRGYVVEIAVIDSAGATLFHSLVNPQARVSAGARAVHQISDEELACAPTLPEVWDRLMAVLSDKQTIITFNAEFDNSTLERDARRYRLVLIEREWQCLMHTYAQYVGDYSEYWHDYRWHPLPDGTHRALFDALAAFELMRRMAASLTRLESDLVEEQVE